MLLGSMTSIQVGAAVATLLFDQVGSLGTAFLRCAFAAVLLCILWRPDFRFPQGHRALVLLFGASLAGASLAFFAAIDRIPLGTAVTLEFSGPLGVALITSRRWRDLFWAVAAAVGIVLLTGGIDGDSLDPIGVLFALVAAFFWGTYIVVGTRLGDNTSGGALLAIAMVIAAAVCLPPGLVTGGSALFSPEILAVGLAVGILSAAIPFSLEFEAMRWLPANVFGVMMSLEPAIAALIGFVILGQAVGPVQAVAIALVVSASAGALHSSRGPAQVEP